MIKANINKSIRSFLLFVLCLCSLTIVLSGCGKHKKRKNKQQSFEKLRADAFSMLEKERHTGALPLLESLIVKYPDNKNIGSYKLLLADTYFKAKRYQEAFEFYQHYASLYPSDTKAEYASYRSLLCRFNQTSSFDRDTRSTEETLHMAKAYLNRSDYKSYQDDVISIARTCRQKLINKEVYVYNFYLRQGKFQSAKSRIEYLKENFLGDEPSLEPRLLYLEGKLARRKKQQNLVHDKVTILVEKYPDSPFAKMARSLVRYNLVA